MNYIKYISLYLFFSFIFTPLFTMEEKRDSQNQSKEIFFINKTGLQLNVIFHNIKFPISGVKGPIPKEANIPAEILLKKYESRPYYPIPDQIRLNSSYGLTLSEKSDLQKILLNKTVIPRKYRDRFGHLRRTIQNFNRAKEFHIKTTFPENLQQTETIPITYGATYYVNFNDSGLEITMIQE